MSGYLAGLLTLPALALILFGLSETAVWVRGWSRRTMSCGICDLELANGPWKTLRLRLHCRKAHGLYLLLSTRVRRRQWHGLSLWYAVQHGATEKEWHEAVRLHR